MKGKVIPLVLAVAGAVLAVGVLTFAGPCAHDDGTVGMCYAASRAVLVAGIVAAVAGLMGAFIRSIGTRMVLAIVGIVAGVVAVASPGGLLPLCMMQTMRCWTAMRPFAMALGVVIALVAVALLVQAVGARRKASKSLPKMSL